MVLTMKSLYFESAKPRFLAHRGSPTKWKENTLESFKEGFQYTPYIETDCWCSSDGITVLHHDQTLERVWNDPRNINECSFSEIKKISNGGIPSLSELLESFPKAIINLEIKDPQPNTVANCLAVLGQHNALNRVLLAAAKDEIAREVKELAPQVPRSASTGEMLEVLGFFKNPGPKIPPTPYQAVQIPNSWQGVDLVQKSLIDFFHSRGIEVHYWTINDLEEIKKILALGADGIVTDFPELALNFK